MKNEENDDRADIELDLKRAFEDEEKVREELAARIAAAETALKSGDAVDKESLAQDYLTCALEAQEEDDFEKVSEWLEKAIALLSAEPNPSDSALLMLGQVHLTYGIALNDQGLWSDALNEYDAAESLLGKVAERGNLEARLDLAGIRLNIATIQFELGKYDESLAAFEKVKGDFSSLISTEKEDDAYYYLAKTYVQESSVCREMGDDEKGLQRLEEGIALFRRMAEGGDTARSVDLAEALAEYAQYLECAGGKNSEEILPVVDESVTLLREGIAAGRADVCPDLLTMSVMKGRLLNYLDRTAESETFLTETAEIFEGIRETEDPSALLTLVSLFDERGKSRYTQQRYEDALADFNEALEIAGTLPADFFDEEEEDHECGGECCCGHHRILRNEGLISLFGVRVNRAKVLRLLGRTGEAKLDSAKAAEILPKVKEYLEEDYDSYREVSEALEKSLQ